MAGRSIIAMALCLIVAPALAADDPNETGRGCIVRGLDPNGDGFLSIRRGPGTQHQEIARAINGDALLHDMTECQGNWCLARDLVRNQRSTGQQGWFFTGYCEFYP
ncbi:MAG: hypothetical protein AAFP13_01385 [Pseudomonadota bacterium]